MPDLIRAKEQIEMIEIAEWMAQGDLVKRWCYTRGGIWKLTKAKDFPAPAFTLNCGRVKVWRGSDIRVFEILHPEVWDEEAKHRKIVGYYNAVGRPYPEGKEPPKNT